MPRHRLDFNTVRKLARELGEVEEVTTRGSPALKVHGKLLACIPIHKSPSLALWPFVSASMIAGHPSLATATLYLTEHYPGYPIRACAVIPH